MTAARRAEPSQPYAEDFSAIYNEKWDLWSRAVWPMIRPIVPSEGAWLDLCCGSGSLLQLARRDGFNVVGVDRSPSQLKNAAAKVPDAKLIEADIARLSIGDRFDVVTCMFDSLNYFTRLAQLDRALRVARHHLKPNGLFIFDIKTNEGFRQEVARIFRTPDRVVIFERAFAEASAIHRFVVTGFVAQKSGYRRFEEVHVQRGYDADLIHPRLRKLGFKLECRDFDTGRKANSRSRRLFYVCRRNSG